jgi:hypothetical protein
VASLLPDLSKACGFQGPFDLAKTKELKPPQPPPQCGGPWEGAWQPAA